MLKTSAGLLMYRRRDGQLQVLLAHPGGPFWHGKDAGAWTIPKGLVNEGEELLTAARREFLEETGVQSHEPFVPLGSVKLKSGKIVHAWAFEGDCDLTKIVSNTFRAEWPPKSGRFENFPEVDRAEFLDLPTARQKINPAQTPLIDQLEKLLSRQK